MSFDNFLCAYYTDLCRYVAVGQLTQAIRNFAKNLEGWLKNAMTEAPEEIVKIKVDPSIGFTYSA